MKRKKQNCFNGGRVKNKQYFGLVLFISLQLVATFAAAAEYTVCSDGCDYSQPEDCANGAQPGDVCLVQDGSYSGWNQTASGSAERGFISVEAAPGASPILTSDLFLSDAGVSYFRIRGFTFQDRFISDGLWLGKGKCDHIQVMDNVFDGGGFNDIDLFADDALISGNTAVGLNRDFIRLFGERFVVRENVGVSLDEDPSLHMDFFQSAGLKSGQIPSRYGLIENNTWVNISGGNVHFSLVNDTLPCGMPPVHLIHRYNKVHRIGSNAVYIDDNNQAAGAKNSSIYNNTFSYISAEVGKKAYIATLDASSNDSAVNNIVTSSLNDSGAVGFREVEEQHHNLYFDDSYTLQFDEPAASEVGAVKNQDPLLSDPDNNDFSTAEGSPARDAGGALTAVAQGDSGSGTTLQVVDAKFFQPGWGGAEADRIAVGSVDNAVQIRSIDYSTNTVELTASITRSIGDDVYLYADSEGTRVLYGIAPDIGAYESKGTADTGPDDTNSDNTGSDTADNQAPIAKVGHYQVVKPGSRVTLDGSKSFDPDGDTLTYQWQQVYGAAVELDDGAGATPTFIAPAKNTILVFKLVVNDGIRDSRPARAFIGIRSNGVR
jgi:hypothetical protein